MRKIVALVVLLFAVMGTACSTSASNRPASTPDPYEVFTTVRNDCGICGTNSPVGGWGAADGRSLVLSEDGTYTAFFNDGTYIQGVWEITGAQLCLNTAGAESCFSYQQKIDTMKLDDAIYIRR